MFEDILSRLEENEKPILNKLACFDTEKADPKTLITAANDPEVFNLEKKYIPQINSNQASDIACHTLISSVGLRPAPIILTILSLKPRRLFLLHTDNSLQAAEKIRDDPDIKALGLRPEIDISLIPFSETDAPANYDQIQKRILPKVEGKAVIDPTGGLKIMGISLAAMSFWRRITMVYLKGEEKEGIVIPFSEKLTVVQNPYDHFGDRDTALIKALFERGNFIGAMKVCEELKESIGDPATVTRFDLLYKFIKLYCDWDAFRHSTDSEDPQRLLGQRLKKLQEDQKRLGINLVLDEVLKGNIAFLSEIEKSWKKGQNLADAYRIVDVFSNAERKGAAGQYDDAIARLYRCLEMCASLMLIENWDVKKTDEPDIKKIVEKFSGKDHLKELFYEKYAREFPEARWGVDDQMKILALVEPNNPAVRGYLSISSESEENNLMKKRNRSILAHGTNPVKLEDYTKFYDKAEHIVRNTLEVKKFNELHAQCKFHELQI